jgi:uncharacterized damage-inducible protein DinB
MITPSYVQTMSAYNGEMNRRLYAAASRLTDSERRANRGAFFKSIHGTLVHLLWGDRTWMSRFDGWPKPAMGAKDSPSMIDDFEELSEQRIKADDDMQDWARRVTREWLEENMIWFSDAVLCSNHHDNRIEQDHRGIKGRYGPMRDFKSHESASRFCRCFDELRNHLQARSRRSRKLPTNARRHRFLTRRIVALRILEAA